MYALWFWFALAALGFAKVAGSGMWKAIGIFYIVASAAIPVAVVGGLLGFVAVMNGFLSQRIKTADRAD
jgi:hypothetical protein